MERIWLRRRGGGYAKFNVVLTHTHTHTLTPRGRIRLLHSLVVLVLLLKIANHRDSQQRKFLTFAPFFAEARPQKLHPRLIWLMGINKIKSQRRKSALAILLEIALRRRNFSCTSSLLLEILFHVGLQNICTNARSSERCAFPASCRTECTRFKSDTTSIWHKIATKEVIMFYGLQTTENKIGTVFYVKFFCNWFIFS